MKNYKSIMLNVNYYNDLINKYSIQQDCNKTVYLSASMILKNYGSRNVYFNFPKSYNLQEIINLLYEDLSKQIFKEYADITGYSIGDKLKRNGEKGKKLYIVTTINVNSYQLKIEKDTTNTVIYSTFDQLKKNYTQIKQSTRKRN